MPRGAIPLAAACTLLASLGAAGAQGLTTAHSFSGNPDGSYPEAALIRYHGLYYGTTLGGGTASHGTIFSFNPATNTVTTLYSFAGGTDGATPLSPLLAHRGTLYGTTSAGGAANIGTVYKFDPVAQTESVLHSFAGPEGNSPQGAIVLIGNAIYGGTYSGGAAKYDGVIYKTLIGSGRTTIIHSFTGGSDGETAAGGLLNDAGILYGTALGGGATGNGTLFKIDTSTDSFSVPYSFVAATGGNPQGGLALHNGLLYGTTYGGGTSGNGTVFQFNPATAHLRDLYNFAGGSDGALPRATPLFHAGALYGSTTASGTADHGTIFKLVPRTKTETVLYTFTGGTDGGYPGAPLLYSTQGLLGSTVQGGANSLGTLFEIP